MHPERINNMKNLSTSELSRRRLVPAKKSKAKAQQDPAPPSEPPAAVVADGEVAAQGSGSEAATSKSSGSKVADS